MFYCSTRIQENIKKICCYWTDTTMQNHLPNQNIVIFLRQVNLLRDGGIFFFAMTKCVRGAFHHPTLMDNCQKF